MRPRTRTCQEVKEKHSELNRRIAYLDKESKEAQVQLDESLQVEISKKKQELRDVTNVKLEEIKTAEELSEVWPQCLGQKPNNI